MAGASLQVRPGRALWTLLARHRVPLAGALLLSVLAAGLSLAQPLLVNRIIASIGQTPIGGLVGSLAVLLAASAVVSAAQLYVLARTAESAVFFTRRSLIARLLRLPVRTYDEHRTGDLVSRMGSDTTKIQSAFSGGLVDAVGGLVVLVGSIVAMALLDVVMLGIVLAVTVIALGAVLITSARIQRLSVATQESVGRLGADLERALSAIRTVRAANAEERIEEELTAAARAAYRNGIGIARVEAVLGPITGLALQIAFLAVLGIGGARVASGALSVADLVTFVLFLFMVAMPLGQIFGAIMSVREAMGAMERIQGVLAIDPEDSGGSAAFPRLPGSDARVPALEIAGVSFGYRPGHPVLRDVSFSVAAGATTAIVGPSGSGKSTLLSLIERFYDLDAGRIHLAGVDIRDLDRTALRSAIGYVEQQAPVLAGTIRDNLRLAGPEATDEQCWDVLTRVDLHIRFERADGLDSVLGDHGLQLSGGERQRLALARVLLTDAPLLLLDEPTASVDSRNEQLIADAVAATAGGRTLVIVAHRLSTVRAADQIVVMDQGVVDAVGTHSQLVETSALYRDLARRQFLAAE